MRVTQTYEILNYLKSGNGLTSKQAFELYGATRLSAIIFNLKNKGYNIICEREQGVNRYGETVSYGVYHLIKENEQK